MKLGVAGIVVDSLLRAGVCALMLLIPPGKGV